MVTFAPIFSELNPGADTAPLPWTRSPAFPDRLGMVETSLPGNGLGPSCRIRSTQKRTEPFFEGRYASSFASSSSDFFSSTSNVARYGLDLANQLRIVRILLEDDDISLEVDFERLLRRLDDSLRRLTPSPSSPCDQITIRSAESSMVPTRLPPIRWSRPSSNRVVPPVRIVTCSGGVRFGAGRLNMLNSFASRERMRTRRKRDGAHLQLHAASFQGTRTRLCEMRRALDASG